MVLDFCKTKLLKNIKLSRNTICPSQFKLNIKHRTTPIIPPKLEGTSGQFRTTCLLNKFRQNMINSREASKDRIDK